MSHVKDYVDCYGYLSFNDKPFTKEDNVALCTCYYMPLDKVVSPSFDEEPIPFGDACRALFELRGNEHKPVGLVLVKGISELMMAMAEQKRYSEMKIVACTDNFCKVPAVQFNACTLLLPDGKIVVLFRGTDDTLTGWKEDLDMLASKEGIPSEHLSVEYLKEVASHFEGDIIVCGHSKGGYVANYAVMHSDKEIRDRVIALYNNDGPGFASYDYLSSDVYKELLPKYHHLIPQSSFIGMMLLHDEDYTVIKSTGLIGALQHDLLTWVFDGDKLVECDDITKRAKVSDLAFYDIVSNVSDEQLDTTEKAVGTIIEGIGQRGLLDVKENVKDSIKGGVAAWKSIDKESKEILKETAKDAVKAVTKAVKAVASDDIESVEERAKKA